MIQNTTQLFFNVEYESDSMVITFKRVLFKMRTKYRNFRIKFDKWRQHIKRAIFRFKRKKNYLIFWLHDCCDSSKGLRRKLDIWRSCKAVQQTLNLFILNPQRHETPICILRAISKGRPILLILTKDNRGYCMMTSEP